MEYPAGLSRNQKRRHRQYKQQLDATCLEPEIDLESETILDGDMPIVAPLEVDVAQTEAESIGMDRPISTRTRSRSPSPTKAAITESMSPKSEKTVAFPAVKISGHHTYEPLNLPNTDLYVSQAKIDRNWREADRLMTRRKDWWNVRWSGRKKKQNSNSQSESIAPKSKFSENNPQTYQCARTCQVSKITTCSVIRVNILPAVNDDLFSVMQRGDEGRQSDKGGFGSRTESGKFRLDRKQETESSMEDSEVDTLTSGLGGADESRDWEDGLGKQAAALIEPSPPGGQDLGSTLASAWGNPELGALDQSFWDTTSDQLLAQAQMAFHERMTHQSG